MSLYNSLLKRHLLCQGFGWPTHQSPYMYIVCSSEPILFLIYVHHIANKIYSSSSLVFEALP